MSLKKQIEKSGLKKEFIARSAKLHPSTLSRIIAKKLKPSEKTLRRILDVINK